MHATIVLSQSIGRILQYHELKVKRGQAELLEAGNFLKDAPELSYREKLFHFERLISLNEYAEKPVLHVFLRFNLTDKISNEQMKQMAREYLGAMGFGRQPWLAYRHYDALHDHAHLVSTTIQSNGKRIVLTLDELKHSRELTHGLERKYGLNREAAEMALRAQQRQLRRIDHGQVSLYPAMKAVLEAVVPHYRYTSLGELNAVLGLYNIQASRGREESVTYAKKGLIYYPLKANGRVGDAYIKASVFPSRPTLEKLEQYFVANQALREAHRQRLVTTIDYALAGSTLSYSAFQRAMAREKISVVRRDGAEGVDGARIWYVDHASKVVFEGATLGARYTVAGVQQRTIAEEVYRQRQLAQEEGQRQGHRMRHSL